MKLIDEWKAVATKAWSVRLAVASALFAATDVIIPIITPEYPTRAFTMLAGAFAIGSALVRVIQQQNLKAPDA